MHYTQQLETQLKEADTIEIALTDPSYPKFQQWIQTTAKKRLRELQQQQIPHSNRRLKHYRAEYVHQDIMVTHYSSSRTEEHAKFFKPGEYQYPHPKGWDAARVQRFYTQMRMDPADKAQQLKDQGWVTVPE